MLRPLADAAEDPVAHPLSPRERVGLLGNLRALLQAGLIHGDVYLDVLTRFSGDSEPEVAEALVAALIGTRDAFVTEDLETPYAALVRRVLGPALLRIGLARRADEPDAVSLLRPQLLETLGDEGEDSALRRYADSLAAVYRTHPRFVDPAIADVVLRLSAISGDRALFDEYVKRFEAAQSPTERARYLSALGSFRRSGLPQAALDYALTGPLRAQELFRIPRGIASVPGQRDLAYRWMTEHYEAIASRIPASVAPFLVDFADGCSRERLANARIFFSDPKHRSPGTDEELAKVTDSISDCARLRERELARVAQYLLGATGGE
jgi:hypothetical protein